MSFEAKNIRVGSLNKAKIGAVAEIANEYPHLSSASVEGVDVNSEVSGQPLSLDETIRGAKNRARNAHDGKCDYSVGIESGLMEVPHTKSGYMDVSAAAIHDGSDYHVGLSSAWEFPDPNVMHMISKEGMEMAHAVQRAGLTDDPSIGSNLGAIGLLTRGKVDRKAFTMQALRNAFLHIDPQNKK